LLIVFPAAALLAGAWFLGQSMKPATERIREMKQVMDLDGSFTAWSEEERKIVPSTAR
jgi:hypothetical protein